MFHNHNTFTGDIHLHALRLSTVSWLREPGTYMFLTLFLALVVLLIGTSLYMVMPIIVSGAFVMLCAITARALPIIQRYKWEQIAEHYDMIYQEHLQIPSGVLFFETGREKTIQHALSGVVYGKPFSVWSYQAKKEHTRSRAIQHTTVYRITFAGSFPHLYLNNRLDTHHVPFLRRAGLQHVTLDRTFDKKFRLYVPRKYEIEALAIFDSDTLHFLLTHDWHYDVEFVGGYVYMFRDALFVPDVMLTEDIPIITIFIQHFAPKLDRAEYVSIGTLSDRL